MSKLKKIAIYLWIFLQVLVISYLWAILGICAFFPDVSINDYIQWDWWILFFVLDLWTYKFFASRKLETDKSFTN